MGRFVIRLGVIQRVFEKRSNKTLLYYCSAKRVNEKTKKTMIERIGYLEDLQAQYPDPLALLSNGTYMNTYCDNVISDIGKALNLSLTQKFYSKGNLVTECGKTVKKS